MSYYDGGPMFPWRRGGAMAAKKLAKLKKNGQAVSPVTIEGRAIAKSFWGKSWCANLERYSDYENRLPRGRTYVRNGSVVDLQIAKSQVWAVVSGSALYKVAITIAPSRRHVGRRFAAIVRGLSIRWSSCCRAAFPRASWTGSAGRAMASFPRPRRSSCPAAVPTGPTCVNMSRRCSMASAPGSMKSLRCSSSYAVSTKTSCSQMPDRTFAEKSSTGHNESA